MNQTIKGVKFPHVRVKLSNRDGNAMVVLVAVRQAMRRARVAQSDIDEYTTAAKAGNYDNLHEGNNGNGRGGMSKLDDALNELQTWATMNIGSYEATELTVRVARIVFLEREECAKIADMERHADKAIAKAIRARSEMRH